MNTSEIAALIGGELVGDGNRTIKSVAALDSAGPDQVTFCDGSHCDDLQTSAGCIIVPANFESESDFEFIKVANPKFSFAKIAAILHPPRTAPQGIHKTAEISDSATVERDVAIGAFCTIAEGASIGSGTIIMPGVSISRNVSVGNDCFIHPNVTIGDECELGSRVILFAGAVIGTDGFGYVREGDELVKFPQIGNVVIDDDVEIGANTCIDRGALGSTRIGKGTKIDNLVQIAHNVSIGRRVLIAANVGISGSVVIEDDVVIGGQVGLGDHATIKSGAILGARSGVFPGKIVQAGFWAGTPVQPIDKYKKQLALTRALVRSYKEIKELINK